jgi:outer membrane lipoprotein SlyB
MIGAWLLATAGQAQTPAAVASSSCSDFPCGRVESIVQVTVTEAWTPLGGTGTQPTGSRPGEAVTVFQFGPGMTNQGMVLLGAAGGAVYKKTPNSYQKPQWQVTVKLDSGRTRVVTVGYEPYVREGDRVRVVGSNVEGPLGSEP